MSEPTNPYEAPKSNLAVGGELPLASPWIRLGAALIDGIVLAPVNFVLQRLFLSPPSSEELVELARKGEIWSPPIGSMLLISVIGLVVFIAVNYVFLKKGQTIGKMALKLQIQNRNTGALLPVNELILKRILVFWGAGLILSAIHPLLGILILADVLCIFRPGRNTLHDDVANTKVVKLPG
jgi:uncharacterized RDD family membrane protein YckC